MTNIYDQVYHYLVVRLSYYL